MQLLNVLSLLLLASVSAALARKTTYMPPLAQHVQHELRKLPTSQYKTYRVSNDTTKAKDGFNGLPQRLRGVLTNSSLPGSFG